jgi:DMSO/TMAO reductase YedYZ molybdopterin-dependent catalytic subunit
MLGKRTRRVPHAKPQMTPQQVDGMFSTSEWTGVLVSALFREVGVHSDAKWFLAEGGDACLLARSVPGEQGTRRRAHRLRAKRRSHSPGAGVPDPSRLPGYEGNTNVKWLRRLKLGTEQFADALGNIEVHGPASRRKGADVQPRDGCEVDHHVARISKNSGPAGGRSLVSPGPAADESRASTSA